MKKPQLKIFQVITRMSMGGAPLYVFRLASHLQKQGHHVSIVYGQASPDEGEMFDYFKGDEFDPSKVEIRKLVREISLFQDLKALLKLIRLFRKERPDIVHTHTSKAGCLGRIAAYVAGVPIILHSSHGTFVRGYFSPLKTKILVQVERFLKHITSRVIAVTELVRQELIQYSMASAEKCLTIHPGFELERLRSVDSYKGYLRSELQIDGHVKIVGTIARLVSVKALDDFLKAAYIILKQNPMVHFVIAGDGELRQALERQARELGIEKNVSFIGFRMDLEVLYADYDVMVVSSLNEGCPASILEAMAAEIPVVSTAVGGIPDIVKMGFTGLLVPPKHPEKLAESVLRLLENPSYGETLAHNAKDTAYNEYSIEVSAARTENVYLQLHTNEQGAVFLDRDGVINKVVMRDGMPCSPRNMEEFQFMDGVQNALRMMQKKGFLIIIVTNQPELSRGLLHISDLDKMHSFIRENLPIHDIFVCAHEEYHQCSCRKPKPGMLFAAAEKWKIDLKKSFMIGDRSKDLEAGKQAGCCPILVDATYNQDIHCHHRARRIIDVVDILGLKLT